MKKPLLVIAGLLYCLSSFAQIPLDSFYKKGSTWVNMLRITISYPLSQPPYVGYTHYIHGYKLETGDDTIVNSITYRKMYYRQLGNYQTKGTPPYWPTATPVKQADSQHYIGRIRVQNRKVYFADEGESKNPVSFGVERIMYDFSGNIGDSVECYLYPYKMKVTNIDSIQLNTGDFVKRYYYNGNTNYQTLEGIGSRAYTLPDMRTVLGMPPSVNDMTTVCYSSGNISYHYPVDPGIFHWYLMERCFDIDALGVEKTEADNKLSLYPNPANGSFTIKGKIPSGETGLTIYNSLGQVIYAAMETTTANFISKKITLPDAPAGIYRVVIQSETGQQVLPLVLE